MLLFLYYTLSAIALLIGTAPIYMTLLEKVPISWVYYVSRIRKILSWLILGGQVVGVLVLYLINSTFSLWSITPLIISALSVIMSYRLSQDKMFPAVDFPKFADDYKKLILLDDTEVAVIEYNGVTKYYPLNYVIHKHIVNDIFDNKMVALTYCAMCRSIIPFDITDLGPLYVASFKNANMIVADRRTSTFFQQASFSSVIGRLHPTELCPIPYQILSWKEVRINIETPLILDVTDDDLRNFELPIPGLWNKLLNSELTPGLSKNSKDKTFPARTRIIGITMGSVSVVYLKEEIILNRIVVNNALGIFIIASNDSILAFKNTLEGQELSIQAKNDNQLIDSIGETTWNLRGKYISGKLQANLEPIRISDEYWFSWQRFKKGSKIIRLV